jgi:hypothetical protein
MREKDHGRGRGGPGRPGSRRNVNALWLLLVGAVVVLAVFFVIWASRSSAVRTAERSPPAADDPSRGRSSEVTLRVMDPVVTQAPARIQQPVKMDDQRGWTDILECWDQKVCPKGTVCWMGDDGHLGCFESNCRSVADREKRCGGGQACLPVSKMSGAYRCIAAGPISLGGSCLDPMIATPARNCQAGLMCVGTLCRQLCGPGTGGCPSKEVCVQQTVRDWACMPGCSSDAECNGGQVCLHAKPAVPGTCVVVPKGTCRPDRPDSCPAGQACDYNIVDGRMLTGICRPSCGTTDCPAGSTCWATFDSAEHGDTHDGRGVCLLSCSDDGHGCPVDQVCMALDEGATKRGCRRAFHDARPAIDVGLARGSFGDPVAVPR